KISCSIEPGLVVEAFDVHHQRLALPVAMRPTHPCVDRTFTLVVHVDGSSGARKLVGDQDVLRSLDNLKGKRHVRGPRYTGQVTLHFRVSGQPFLSVLFLFRRGPRLVRDSAAFYNAQTGGNGADRAERNYGSGPRSMTFNVPIGRADRLPDT